MKIRAYPTAAVANLKRLAAALYAFISATIALSLSGLANRTNPASKVFAM
jgi:hypothetical protein